MRMFLRARRDGGVCSSSSRAWSWVRNIRRPKKKFGNFFSGIKEKNLRSLCVRLSWCSVISPPRVPMSPGGDPVLSCLLVGVGVMQGVTAMRAEHHIPVCCLLCRLVGDLALCLSFICGGYTLRFTGDRRDFILFSFYPTPPPPNYLGGWPRCMSYPLTKRGVPRGQPESSSSLVAFPSRTQCSGKGAEAGSDPIWLHLYPTLH